VLVPYARPLTGAGDLHKIAVEMYFAAYGQLGFGYKLSNGYYGVAIKMAEVSSH
jgi:hypothetical protein